MRLNVTQLEDELIKESNCFQFKSSNFSYAPNTILQSKESFTENMFSRGKLSAKFFFSFFTNMSMKR